MRRVVLHEHGLGVARGVGADLFVTRIGRMPTGVANRGSDDPRHMAEGIFDPPKAPPGKSGELVVTRRREELSTRYVTRVRPHVRRGACLGWRLRGCRGWGRRAGRAGARRVAGGRDTQKTDDDGGFRERHGVDLGLGYALGRRSVTRAGANGGAAGCAASALAPDPAVPASRSQRDRAKGAMVVRMRKGAAGV